jgi:hypothetical protein
MCPMIRSSRTLSRDRQVVQASENGSTLSPQTGQFVDSVGSEFSLSNQAWSHHVHSRLVRHPSFYRDDTTFRHKLAWQS